MEAEVFLIAEFSGWGQAYVVANGFDPKITIIEILGTGTIIARGKVGEIKVLAKGIAPAPVLVISEDNGDKLLEIFYSLHHAKIKDSILIYENSSLVKIFHEAESWINQGIEIHDFRPTRVSSDPHLLIGTTVGDPQPKSFAKEVRVLYPINSQIKSFFDIDIP